MATKLQDFIGSMNKSGGFARPNRYEVRIFPPPKNIITGGPHIDVIHETEHEILSSFNRQVNLHCDSIKIPGHDLKAQSVQHGSAPAREMVTSHDYAGTIDASFYLDSHLRERLFFEKWMKLAVDVNTHKAKYYDDYIGSMEIYQLNGNDEITYGVKVTEVYPTTIGPLDYSHGGGEGIHKQTVMFQYRQWLNMTQASIIEYTRGEYDVVINA